MDHLSSLFWPRRLWGRLTVAYAAVTAVGLLTLLLLSSIITDYVYFRRANTPETVLTALDHLVESIASDEQYGSSDALSSALKRFSSSQLNAGTYHVYQVDYFRSPGAALELLRTDGSVIASTARVESECAFGAVESNLAWIGSQPEGAVYARVEVPGQPDHYLCSLHVANFQIGRSIVNNLIWMRGAAPYVVLIAVILGVVFGGSLARSLVSRLHRIERTAQSWSHGSFDDRIQDTVGDEISELCDRLNSVADELSELVDLRHAIGISEERFRVARELHDSVKQQLFALSMQLAAVRNNAGDQMTFPEIREAERLLRLSQQELAGIIIGLQEPSNQSRDLPKALGALIDDFEQRFDVLIKRDLGDRNVLVAAGSCSHLLRITEEALTNCFKHANASMTSVQLHQSTHRIELTIRDNGVGFCVGEAQGGLGLQNLNSRAAELPGGKLTTESELGHGTTTRVTWAKGV
ncbi:MAG: sensor histidine kinase [Pseudomonadota bacterium]